MKKQNLQFQSIALFIALGLALAAGAQTPDNSLRAESSSPAGAGLPSGDGPSDFGGPPPFGPGGFGPGGPGGMMQAETKLVKQFDKDGDKRLNQAERKAAREFLARQKANQSAGRGPGGPGGRRGGFGFPGQSQTPTKPGPKLSPAEVKSFPDASVYDLQAFRTFFLEFENADWEKELADFKNTDVEVPAKLTVDGRVYPDVGVHFHGMSSYMMVGEGQKRSLVLSLDFVHPEQQLGGYRKLNLLNSHEDPSFLHTVLSLQIARDYMPAPKANFVQVAINGESWGVYVNQQHFNKDFVKEWFDTTKGARWKVRGSPGGRGGFNYLGEDVAPYKQIYEMKTKDDPQAWMDFIKLCKVLNETSANQLESALAPLLDLDSTLKFLAWDNALANGDGFWTRASDYELYQDEQRRFHVIPYDANETFSSGGGPGGPGGRGGFGPGMFVAPQIFVQADKDANGKLTKKEFTALADAWYDKLDPEKSGKLDQEQFLAKLDQLLPPPQGFGPPGGGQSADRSRPGGGRGGFGPAMFLGPGLFTVSDANNDGSLTRAELADRFAKWFADWDTGKSGELNEESFRNGLNAALPRPNFGGPGGPGGGPGGMGGGRGPRGPGGGGPGSGGVELDPLVAVNDTSKPLLSKLLAVPSLRTRYLGYVRDIAEKWLDWNRLDPLAKQYQALIADAVETDTRKLDSTEAFLSSIGGDAPSAGGPGGQRSSGLKSFVEKRRAFLLNYQETSKAGK